MSHVLWKELEAGLADETMQRTIAVLKALSEGFEMTLGGRTIIMTEQTNGGPYFAIKAMRMVTGVENDPIALGMDCDLGFLYALVKNTSETDWIQQIGGVAWARIHREAGKSRGRG
jgi:hypothetical protein